VINIDASVARRLCLQHQGLLKPGQFSRGVNAAQTAIEQLSYLQIDTISVVDRTHHHVLQNRVPNYRPALLHRLLTEKRSVFEYWFHAAAYLPMADYRYYLPVMRGYAAMRKVDRKLRAEIIAKIRDQGSIQARDFDNLAGRNRSGWWDWKPAKLAMEVMFLSGELMVRERQGFRKIYDLTENVLPPGVDTRGPGDAELGQFYVRAMLKALGIATARDIAYARQTVKHFSKIDIQPLIASAIEQMLAAGEIQAVNLNDELMYCAAKAFENLPVRVSRDRVRFLSPFDNLIINRRRLITIFNFDYQLECYIPESKRRYGYFTLPMLYGDTLIGRMDCKADRKRNVLLVHNIWLEDTTRITDALLSALRVGLYSYCRQLGCSEINIAKDTPGKLHRALQ
jgi:uncharacterized protein